MTNFAAEAEGHDSDRIIDRLLEHVPQQATTSGDKQTNRMLRDRPDQSDPTAA